MKSIDAIRYEQLIPEAMRAFASAKPAINAVGLEPALQHLVRLRASQINGCAFCVTMHTGEARADGETSERLDRLVVWPHVDDFTPQEQVALAWTQALTSLADHEVLAGLRAQLRQHFSEQQVAALGAEVAMINLWNRIAISNH